MKHDLKIWPKYFEAVQSGDKTFEWRINDRDYRVGDSILLREYDPNTKEYTDRESLHKITYTLEVDDTNIILAIKPLVEKHEPEKLLAESLNLITKMAREVTESYGAENESDFFGALGELEKELNNMAKRG